MSVINRIKALFTARKPVKATSSAAVAALSAEISDRTAAVEATARAIRNVQFDITADSFRVTCAAARQEMELQVSGAAVPEPKAPKHSTTASRRQQAAKRDRQHTTAVPTAYGLNRAQRRALGLHKVAR